jgi:hypothetical protein
MLLIFLEATHLSTTQFYKKICCEVLLEATAYNYNKGTVSRDLLLLVFFHESVSPQPESIPLGPF